MEGRKVSAQPSRAEAQLASTRQGFVGLAMEFEGDLQNQLCGLDAFLVPGMAVSGPYCVSLHRRRCVLDGGSAINIARQVRYTAPSVDLCFAPRELPYGSAAFCLVSGVL